jgi:AcrR family transcriptional regulator
MKTSDQEDKILQAGIEELMESEVSKFTVDSFSKAIKMSKKTIYKIFPTKEDLIRKIVEFAMKQVFKSYEEIVKSDTHPIEKFWKMIHAIYSHIRVNPEKISFIKTQYPHIWKTVEQYRLKNLSMYESVFDEAQEMGLIKTGNNTKDISILFMNIIHRTFQPEFFVEYKIEPRDAILNFAEIYSRGVFGDITIRYKEKVFKKD